jgi:hypothetical protein
MAVESYARSFSGMELSMSIVIRKSRGALVRVASVATGIWLVSVPLRAESASTPTAKKAAHTKAAPKLPRGIVLSATDYMNDIQRLETDRERAKVCQTPQGSAYQKAVQQRQELEAIAKKGATVGDADWKVTEAVAKKNNWTVPAAEGKQVDRQKAVAYFLEQGRSAEAKAKDDLAAKTREILPACDERCQTELAEICASGQPLEKEYRSGLFAAVSAGPGVSAQGALLFGLTSFLADRSNDELASWLTRKLMKTLCDEDEAKFRLTCELRKKVNEDQLGTLFVAALRRDLETLPLRLLARQTGVASKEEIEAIIILLQSLRAGESPVAALAKFGGDGSICVKGPSTFACKAQAAARLAGLLGDALKPQSDAGPFVANLPKHTASLQALITRAEYCTTFNVCEKEKDETLTMQLQDLLQKAHGLNQKLWTWSDEPVQDEDRRTRALVVADESIEILEKALGVVAPADTTQAAHLAKSLRAGARITLGNYADGILQTLELVPKERVYGALEKYLPLLVDLASAKDVASARQAIDSAAAPLGGWRQKREGFTSSLTGLVGFGGNVELAVDRSDARAFAIGLHAPVGLDFSGPTGKGHTFGLYLSVIDLGQLLTVPVVSSTPAEPDGTKIEATANDDVELIQVLSPGLYLRWGIGDTPFSLAVGGSYAPRLRRFTPADDLSMSMFESQEDVFRLSLGLGVDVTILSL